MRIISLLFLFMTFFIANAQKIMTVEEAVSLALKNNFDIIVAQNNVDIAKTNNTPGNAGMLPNVRLIGSGYYELNNVNQILSSGTENAYPSQAATSLNAGVELSWTLFDGGKMFVTKNKLNEIQTLGEIQFKEKVLQTVSLVISVYYDIVRQKQELIAINEVINFNTERVKIAQSSIVAGSFTKTDLLNAQIDLNVARENAIKQQYTIDATKRKLKELLTLNLDADFEVVDSITVTFVPDKNDLMQQLNSSNTTLLFYQKQTDIARLTMKENTRTYWPLISLSGGYYWNQAYASMGSILNNRSLGPQVGGSIVIPLYSSGETKRKVSIAKIQVQSSELELEQVKLQMNMELENLLSEYNVQTKLLEIEKENNALAKENLDLSLERLRLGQTTSLEVHQAQENYIQSSTRLLNFEYALKIVEIKIKQLISTL
ncbi:MAG: outer rane efflux protein [Bacteroidetes bacterium]|nr:outer rane efflux protein [Bacteroidota bacterium]